MGPVVERSQEGLPQVDRTTLVEARHLHFGFADRVILRDLHLVLGRGEVVGLVGPNGAGKTTLLRLLAGEKSPSSGTVTRLGETLVGPTLRRRIGYLPDDAALFDELTGLENLLLFAGVRSKASSARADECRALAMALGLSELQLQERVATYSFGMRRKVAIGQSLTGAPELLLLDEPTIGLDPNARDQLAHELHVRKPACAILIASNDLRFAQDHCDRVLFLAHGRIVLEGQPADLLQPLQDEAEFAVLTRDVYCAIHLPDITAVQNNPRQVRFRSRHGSAALPAIIDALQHAGNEIESIEIRRSDLSDVFRQVTGEDWSTAWPK